MKIFYKPEVELFINELVFDLYLKEYSGFFESAVKYKDKIIDFIENNIETFSFRNSPFRLRNLGTHYIFYKANDRTTWYIFFEKKDEVYLITFITNNHTETAKYL